MARLDAALASRPFWRTQGDQCPACDSNRDASLSGSVPAIGPGRLAACGTFHAFSFQPKRRIGFLGVKGSLPRTAHADGSSRNVGTLYSWPRTKNPESREARLGAGQNQGGLGKV